MMGSQNINSRSYQQNQTNSSQDEILYIYLDNNKMAFDVFAKIIENCRQNEQIPTLTEILIVNSVDFPSKYRGDSIIRYINKLEWTSLQKLVLHENDLTDCAIKNMATKVALNLHTIDLSLNCITNQGIKELCLANWSCLRVLNLQDNLFNSKGITSFIDNKWQNLTDLNLSNNKLQNRSLNFLIKCPWRNLTKLSLMDTGISSDGFKIIERNCWNNLECLDISYNRLNSDYLRHLVRADWPKLARLQIFKIKRENEMGSFGLFFHSNFNSQLRVVANARELNRIMKLKLVSQIMKKFAKIVSKND